jgi:hypothetical protein
VRRLTSRLIQNSTLFLACFLPLANAQSPNSNLNRWARTADMTVARDQACAAVLSDGRLLVAGGTSAAGPLSTVDIYATDGTFTAGPAMLQARAQAACVALRDGTVLVTGGDGGSGALNTAEIFDPATNKWKATGNLAVARKGHQAAITVGGNVWIAGGTNDSGMVGAIEMYGAGKFHSVGSLNTPRTDFAMSPAGERSLVIAGGSDGTNTLASVELYDGLLQTLTVAGNMSQARKNFAAAPLLDGTVLLTGGLDTDGNLLSTTEIFDPVAGISTAGPALVAARANHVAYSLPGNGSVLIFGGTGFSTVLNSTEIFTPWTGKIIGASPLSVPRRNEAKANLRPGSFLIAGGRDDNGSLSSSELYQFATIGTDKSDYAPGTPVKISGGGWTPGEQVLVEIAALPLNQNHVEFTGTATADGAGNITVDGFAVDRSHLGMKFLMTATGSKSEAQTAFTDAFTPIVTLSIAPPNQPPGTTVTATITVSPDQAGHPVPTGEVQLCDGSSAGGNGNCPTSYLTTPCTTGFTTDFCALTPGASNATATMQVVLPAGNTSFGVIYFPDVASQGTYTFVNASQDFGQYTALSVTTTSMTSGPAGNTPYGSQTPYVATVTVTGGGVATGPVTFCDVQGLPLTCSASTGPNIIGTVTLANANNNIASLIPTTPLSIGSHTIIANYAGDNSNATSTTTNSIVTNIQATNTSTSYTLTPSGASATAPPATIVFSQDVTTTATVTANAGGGTPTGTVQFAVDGSNVGVGITLSGGSATKDLGSSLAVGNHTVSAAFSPAPSTGWNGSTGNNGGATAIVVNPANTTVATALFSGAGTGTPTFTVTVTGTAPATANPTTGAVTLYDGPSGNSGGSVLLGTGNLSGTNSVQITSTVTLTPAFNPHNIWAAYAATTNFAAGNSTGQTYNVTPPIATTVQQPAGPTTFVYGATATFTGTVTAASGVSNPGGASNFLTFCIKTSPGGASVICPTGNLTINATGSALVGQSTFTIPATTSGANNPPTLAPGNYTITSSYTNGDGKFANSGPSTALNFTVTKATAPFTLSATVANAQNLDVTNPITITATYNNFLLPAPTGSVTFFNSANGGTVGTTPICSGTLSAGVASCTATAGPGAAAGLQVGPVTIAVSYAGDANYTLGAVTPPYTVTVTKDAVTFTTLTATSVDSPSATQIGRTVTVTATATASTINVSPAGTTPTQANISIALPNTNVVNSTCAAPTPGAVTTNSATVTCTFQVTGPLPSPPSLTITANYSGDAYTLTATKPVALTVGAGPTTTTIPSITNVGGDALSAVQIGRVVTINAQTVTPNLAFTAPTGSFTFNFTPGSVAVNNTANPGGCGNLTTGATSATVTTTASSVNGTTGVGTATASCTFILTQPAGAKSYTVTYNGDVNTITSSSAASQITAVLANTTTTLAAPTNNGSDPNTAVQYGRVVTLTATALTAANDVAPLNGTFTFSLPANSALTSSCGTLVNNGTTATVTTTSQSRITNSQNSATASCAFVLVGPQPIAAGTYSATYNTDSTNSGTSSSGTQTITPALDSTSLSATCTFGTGSTCAADASSTLVFGQPFTLTATLGSTTLLPAAGAAYQASKSVTFVGPNGINYVVPIVPSNGVGGGNVAGTASISSPSGVPFTPPAGSYTLGVSYPTPTADPYYGASTGQVTFVINKAPVTVVVTPLPVSLAGVPNLQVTVAFAGNSTAGVPTGTVTVLNGGAVAATAPLGVTSTNCPQGRAPCGSALFALPSGTYSATYSGDSNFLSGASASSSPTTGVSATSSVSLIATPNPAQPGQQITITATVSGSNGNGNPTGTVSFTDNATLIGVAPVIGGVATLTVTLAPGSHVVSGSYSGDATYPASSNNLNISVTKPNANTTFSSNVTASVFGQGVTLTVRFTSPTTGGTLPTGTVQFLDNGQPIGSPVTINNGVATLTLASLPPGTNNIGVQYSGDGSFANLTKNVGTVTVTQAQVTTTLTSTTNGSQMTLTATLAVVAPGAGAPTGTVQFIDTLTGAVLGTAPVNNGVATITITATGDPIKAVYSGDTNFSTSQSPASATIALSDAASYAQTYAAGEIVTVFGSGLTTQTLSASLPLPVTLGGITVTVTDSAGVPRQAALFYVSPTQMSFLIPPGTATGTATVVVTTSAGSLTTTITIVGSTAALFTANANGSGPLAAQVVTVTPSGQQTYTNTAVLSGTTFINAPISLSPASNQYVLLLYGTGFDNAKTVTVTINGQTFTPAYFGPQGTYAGLDQINVLLPAGLAGAGQVNVSVTVDGQTSNAGTIAFAAAGTN